jgi:hypothetical protein
VTDGRFSDEDPANGPEPFHDVAGNTPAVSGSPWS